MIEQKRKEVEEKIADDPIGSLEVKRLEERAEAERRIREYDKAISTLSEAMTLRIACTDKLKAANLDTSAEIAATVRLLHTFGRVFAEKGDTERSERACKDAARLIRKNLPPKSRMNDNEKERTKISL
jgi:hypothetical protein